MPASTPQETIPSNSAQATRTAGIEFSQVTKRYGANTVVNNLTLSIPAGETTVFVGSSGCGKTTTLRMINRMVEPQEGTITIGGQNIADQDPYKLRRSIGYVMQSGGLLPHRTVLENVMTVPLLNGTPKPQAKERALDLLGTVGLDASLAQRYPAQLSGGQAQRVGVARALAADASILLMDEPFSAVDPIVRTELQEELLRLQGELHKTIVFVTHDIDEALFLGDNIAVFAPGGKLAQYGAPEEILTNPANDFVESFVSQSVGALLPADVMRQVRYIRRERYRRTREAAVSGEGAASTSGWG
ncbi:MULTISPECIES: ABC transporter ATP-binding protein [Rothia]|uniref:ABC-type quaternary amine transporter n=1 Tax=Rothia aeria F0474 TaxID=1125724 RepID=I0USH1_9MICC|nr:MULTISPECIES: ATP-binding cassette domain-containing protein [Rothia]EID50824.1 ABC transporter, ATP-binding protein [Rothia aeria F0474]OFR98611.1 ABC transporter ATP-binding protein [Rothia sp. HMSC067H10]